MASTLPDDILYMICGQLLQQRDFDTLFQCTMSGRKLAVPAATHIYRMHEHSPVTSGSDEDQITIQDKADYATKLQQQERIIGKWARLWRTITLSSLGKTLLPYSKYIRTLNLRDLSELLQDRKFQDKFSDYFFQGDLKDFKVEKTLKAPRVTKTRVISRVTDHTETLVNIGGAIASQTPLLEELGAATVSGTALQTWIPDLPRLKRMDVWDGATLRGLGRLLRQHCPHFTDLKFYVWLDAHAWAEMPLMASRATVDTDPTMAELFNDLRPQSLESFVIFSSSAIGPQSFLALSSSHGDTLTELKLNSLTANAMQNLNLLKGCTNITSLLLSESPGSETDLEYRHNDVFLEVVAWLKECKKLQTISLSHFFSGPSLLTAILLEHDIRLRELNLDGYVMNPAKTFHRALVHQPSLQSVCLKGEGDEPSAFGIEGYSILVDSLCRLQNLTDLRLKNIAEYFNDEHICCLAQNLPHLETLETGGWLLTNSSLEELCKHDSLKRLDFSAITHFTAEGILKSIRLLGPGNTGFVLAVLMADMDYNLTSQQQRSIRDAIAKQVGGKFEFQMIRDPDISEFEGDSSD